MARVAIVIVTHNSAHEIRGCLEVLGLVPDSEVVVVDNASTDETVEIVRSFGTRLIANQNNAGFAAGVNIGTRATTAPLILLLNPDAHLRVALDFMLFHFESEQQPPVGIVGGRLVGADGQSQTGFMIRSLPTPTALCFEVLGVNRLWPTNKANWHYRCMSRSPMTRGPAEQPAGAFLMFSRQAWAEVGGFDERFTPVWFEDVDFCARVLQAGYQILYEPAAVAAHAGGHSVKGLSPENRHNYWYGNLLKYAARHFGVIEFRVVCAAVALGAFLRGVSETRRGGLKAFRMYGVVFRHAWQQLFSNRRSGAQSQGSGV